MSIDSKEKKVKPNVDHVLYIPNGDSMRNRAEKDAVRWCHLIHQFIAGASVHSREAKTRVAEVSRYFVSKRFINHGVIIKELKTCPAHVVMHRVYTVVTATL